MAEKQLKGFFLTKRVRNQMVDGEGNFAGFSNFTEAKLQGKVVNIMLKPVTDSNETRFIAVDIKHSAGSRTVRAKFDEETGLWPAVEALKVGEMTKIVGIQQHSFNSNAPHVSGTTFGPLEDIQVAAPAPARQ